MLDRFRSESGVVPHSSRVTRLAATGLLLASAVLSAVAAPVHAQTSPLLSVSTIMPNQVLLYGETKLDPTSDQMAMFTTVLARLGNDEPISETIADENELIDGVPLNLLNAEVGIGLLPIAFAQGTEDLGGLPSLDTDASDIEDSIDSVASDAGSQGTIIVVKPVDIEPTANGLAESSEVDQETYDGVDYYVSNDSGDMSAYAIVDEFVAVATSADEIKLVIDAANDSTASLGANARFQMASGALADDRLAFAYSNNSALIDLISETTPEYSAFLTDLLQEFDGDSGMAVVALENGIRLDLVNMSPNGDATPAGQASDLTLASQVPADTVIMANGNNVGQSIALRGMGFLLAAGVVSSLSESMSDGATPEASPVPLDENEVYDTLAAFFGFNLKTDLFDQLTGAYSFAVWNLDAANPANINAVLTSDVDDAVAVGDVVDTISNLITVAAQGQVDVTSRPVGDNTVNNVTFPLDDQEMSIDFGMVGDEFMVGLGDGIDTITTPPTETLADTQAFTDAVGLLPTEYQAIYYVNIQAIQEASNAASGESTSVFGMEVGSDATTAAESFAAVTWVEGGNTYTSAVLVVPE